MISYDWATYSHTGPTVGTVGFDANAQAAWDVSYGDPSVIIAIIDSGVDIYHEDLNCMAGYDFGDGDTNPMDDSRTPGHGTCCAGVAAAVAGNGIGVAGIAGNCTIMPLKVADRRGTMSFTSITNAIYYAADNGADVISMSLGAAITSDPATDAALQYAFNAGCVILAATGNENATAISYPAINPYVIGVGAASPCGERKRSSSLSTELNPGVFADPNGYTCDGERWWGSNYGTTAADGAGAVDVIAPTIVPTTDISGAGGYDAGQLRHVLQRHVLRHAVRGGRGGADQVGVPRLHRAAGARPALRHRPGRGERGVGQRLGQVHGLRHGGRRGGGRRRRRPGAGPAGGGVCRHAHQRHLSPGGGLQRPVQRDAHQLELDLRRRRDLDRPEPGPHLHRRRHLHRQPDRDQRLRQRQRDQDRVHHRQRARAPAAPCTWPTSWSRGRPAAASTTACAT